MPRALVFGVNGFVGGYLARELAAYDYEVCGSDIAAVARDILDDYVPCDISDAEAVRRVVLKFEPDAIINLAAVSSVALSWKIPQKTVEVNVNGAVNILDAARKQRTLPKVLLIGSSEEYAPLDRPLKETDSIDATNPYGISKAAQERFAELYFKHYGLRVYQTRSFNHTGIGQSESYAIPSWCKQVAEIEKTGKPGVLRTGNLDVRRDFSDVRDIVRAYRMILESDYAGEVFNIGSGTAPTLREIVDLICSFSAQEIEVQADSSLFRPQDNYLICCDCSKAKHLLNWEPRYKLRDTLLEIYGCYGEGRSVLAYE